MKKIFSILLTTVILLYCNLPASAVALSNESPTTDKILTFETITLGDDVLTIPAFVENHTSTMYSTSGLQAGEKKITYYVPATEEGRLYNEGYVQSAILARGLVLRLILNPILTITFQLQLISDILCTQRVQLRITMLLSTM